MSYTLDVRKFDPEYWSYMSAVVKSAIENEWARNRPIKLPAGVMFDLNRFVGLALKGFKVVRETPLDYECHDVAYNVKLIAQKVVPDIKENSIIELFKKLENQLCVLRHSPTPTIVIAEQLDFFKEFFSELQTLFSELQTLGSPHYMELGGTNGK